MHDTLPWILCCDWFNSTSFFSSESSEKLDIFDFVKFIVKLRPCIIRFFLVLFVDGNKSTQLLRLVLRVAFAKKPKCQPKIANSALLWHQFQLADSQYDIWSYLWGIPHKIKKFWIFKYYWFNPNKIDTMIIIGNKIKN